MKTKLKLLLALLTLCTLHSTLTIAEAQGTAFTYQGQLRSNGVPLNGLYDFAFTLSNAPSGGSQVGSPITNLAVGVTNGLFTTTLDFGAVFTGNDTWLAISVRSNNVGSYTPMKPLQELTPTPYAIYTPNAGNAATATSATSAATAATANNVAIGIDITNAVITNSVFNGNGGGLTNLNVSTSQLTSYGNTSGGQQNFFVGNAGNSTTSGSFDTAFGNYALEFNTSGSDNIALGDYALGLNTNGSFNTALGFYALYLNGKGSNNIALGYDAGLNINGGSSNIDIGNSGVSTDVNIIRIGSNQTTAYIAGVITGNGSGLTGLSATQLSGSIPSGVSVPAADLTGTLPVLNGANLTNLNASQLTSINSQNNNPAGNDYANFFIGSAGNATTSGSYNIATGFLALLFNTTGSDNTAYGVYALEHNTTGSDNTAYGVQALSANTTGSNNTAYGVFALQGNTIGNNNTAIGFNTLGDFDAMNGASGSNNIALGYGAGAAYSANESSNIDIGYAGSLGENYTTHIGTSGVQTTAYIAGVITGNGGGLTSLNAANLTGAGTLPDAVLPGNVALLNGNQIFTNVDTFSNGLTVATTAGTLAVIADQNAVPGITATGGLAVGHMRLRNAVEVWPNATQTSAGYLDVRNTANNATISLTGSSGAVVCSNVTANGVVLTSDRNAKQNFTPLDPEAALAKVSAMSVTEWNYKSDPAGTKHIGPMAQDFHAAFGLNGGDDTHISVVDEGGVALAAIQGLNQKLNEKDAEIEKLKAKADKVDLLEKQNDSLAARLNELEAAVKLLAGRN